MGTNPFGFIRIYSGSFCSPNWILIIFLSNLQSFSNSASKAYKILIQYLVNICSTRKLLNQYTIIKKQLLLLLFKHRNYCSTHSTNYHITPPSPQMYIESDIEVKLGHTLILHIPDFTLKLCIWIWAISLMVPIWV
jgi:hypothetical protein